MIELIDLIVETCRHISYKSNIICNQTNMAGLNVDRFKFRETSNIIIMIIVPERDKKMKEEVRVLLEYWKWKQVGVNSYKKVKDKKKEKKKKIKRHQQLFG